MKTPASASAPSLSPAAPPRPDFGTGTWNEKAIAETVVGSGGVINYFVQLHIRNGIDAADYVTRLAELEAGDVAAIAGAIETLVPQHTHSLKKIAEAYRTKNVHAAWAIRLYWDHNNYGGEHFPCMEIEIQKEITKSDFDKISQYLDHHPTNANAAARLGELFKDDHGSLMVLGLEQPGP
jgi:hypothetical protein